MKSTEFTGWRGQNAEQVQEIVDKFNAIAKNSNGFDDGYERRDFKQDNKYAHIRCTNKNCKFNVWFINENGEYRYFRASYSSHCIS